MWTYYASFLGQSLWRGGKRELKNQQQICLLQKKSVQNVLTNEATKQKLNQVETTFKTTI